MDSDNSNHSSSSDEDNAEMESISSNEGVYIKKPQEPTEEPTGQKDKKPEKKNNPVDKSKDRFPILEHKHLLNHYLDAMMNAAVSICKKQQDHFAQRCEFVLDEFEINDQFYRHLMSIRGTCLLHMASFKSFQRDLYQIRHADLLRNEGAPKNPIIVGAKLLLTIKALEPSSYKLPELNQMPKQYDFIIQRFKQRKIVHEKEALSNTLFTMATQLALMGLLWSWIGISSVWVAAYLLALFLVGYTVFGTVRYLMNRDTSVQAAESIKNQLEDLQVATHDLNNWLVDEVDRFVKTQTSTLFVYQWDSKGEDLSNVGVETDGSIAHTEAIIAAYDAILCRAVSLLENMQIASL
ncbi:hypothetical protein BD560DRAFT_414562 [Blakeslea trispora]|nr:hypothetical protein BD560DRAFT_414562 [Blakeslea trispora]